MAKGEVMKKQKLLCSVHEKYKNVQLFVEESMIVPKNIKNRITI